MWPRGGREGQNGARRDRQRPRLIHRIIRLEYADLNIPLRAGIAIIVFSLNYNIIRVYIYIWIRFICVFCKHRRDRFFCLISYLFIKFVLLSYLTLLRIKDTSYRIRIFKKLSKYSYIRHGMKSQGKYVLFQTKKKRTLHRLLKRKRNGERIRSK